METISPDDFYREPSVKQIPTIRAENEEASTFQTTFFADGKAKSIRVPDYQRAFSWEQKQIELFIDDLRKYQGVGKRYYFGHFIAEHKPQSKYWEIVDGQQRITTFVLFLMICRVLLTSEDHANAYSLIENFSTVTYDGEALETIGRNLGSFLAARGRFDGKPPTDDEIINGLLLPEKNFTRSQRRMMLALLHFHKAFEKGELDLSKIGDYIAVVMNAQCSLHRTSDKSIAVNIFELHNTRGVPLTTLEKVKAKLMKFVYDNGGDVKEIQDEFGQIYGMEEQLAARSFRGEMEMEHLLRLHLRVVDDGNKKTGDQFDFPRTNATTDELVEYVDLRLHHIDGDEKKPKIPVDDGVQYALNLAKEFKKSVRIVSEALPAWDEEEPLVGDVLILEPDFSCQFFLIICRCLESGPDKADGRVGNGVLSLWEKLLFTRDFHGEYFNLKGSRDNFPELFASCRDQDEKGVSEVIKGYLADGFRWWNETKGLQSIVIQFLNDNRPNVLNNAFHWWDYKMKYAIYKYEVKNGANIRPVVKAGISVEHILPQQWEWEWIERMRDVPEKLSDAEKATWSTDVGSFINGIGNLLLITGSDNSSVGNKPPADKKYPYSGGSYEWHDKNREEWRSPEKWATLIRKRGEDIFQFMLDHLVDAPEKPTMP